jgi:hypothetical protein
MSCFWPVESVLPRSRTCDLKPSGSERMKSATFTSSAACSTPPLDPFGAQPDVVFDRAAEQERVLQHHAIAPAQRLQIEFADIDAVDLDRPFCTS